MRVPDLPDLRSPAFRLLMALLAVGIFAARGCTPAEESRVEPRYVMVVGMDVSGSFRDSGRFDDALDFLAHYIYGHLNGAGDLREPDALFVGPVGGDQPGEAQGFHPIHDFRGKEPEQIAADLREWFGGEDRLTDFNAFFRRVGEVARKRGLSLAPMNVVIVSDGVPDMRLAGADTATASGAVPTSAGRSPGAPEEAYGQIDLDPLEYLSHSLTVRLLYPEPGVAAAWERSVPRQRVRIWTADATVMAGWRAQLDTARAAGARDPLWTWIRDNVDHPVRGRLF